MRTKKVYNAAIIGCGRIASTFDDDPKRRFIATHAGAYTLNPRIRLIAAADISEDKLRKFGSRWNVDTLYKDYLKMLKNESIDILSICTWANSHHGILEASVKAGVRAIFCEKPISDNLADAEKMIRLCKRKNIILAINHRRRWDKFHGQIKRFIEEGALGRIQSVSVYYTGGLANSCSHLFDILRFFFHDAEFTWAHFKPAEKKDPDADGYIYFKKGFGCSVQACHAANYMIFEIDIYGSRGRLRIEDIGRSASFWKVVPSPDFSESKVLIPGKLPFKGDTLRDTMVNSVEDIIECLDTGKRPLSSGEDGLKSLELITAFYESSASGRKVKLPLRNKKRIIS